MKGILTDRFGGFVHAGLLAAVLLVISGIAQAQTRVTPCDSSTPNNALCISWGAPATNTDGTPTVLPLTYRVEQKFGTGAYTNAATALTVTKFYAQNLAPGTYTFRVYANCTGAGCIEGPPSNEASKAAAANPVQPSAPVIIIAATIRANGPPTYRIVYTVRPREGEIVFVAPESMRQVFAAR